MARVVAFVPDLLFGSQVQGMLAAAGHDVTLAADVTKTRTAAPHADALVVDLTNGLAGADLVAQMRADGELASTRTLAFYSHVEADVRERAQQAGFDVVVPRSRMAREGAALVERLLSG